jgi:hydroxymethylbilane synthase
MIPSAGQGIIAVQCKKENGFEFLSDISDENSHIAATAERAFIKRLDGGCTSPSAAYCMVEGDRVHLIGMNEIDGKMKKAEIWADKDEAEIAGIRLAERLTV